MLFRSSQAKYNADKIGKILSFFKQSPLYSIAIFIFEIF